MSANVNPNRRIAVARNEPSWHGLDKQPPNGQKYWTLEQLLTPEFLGWEVKKLPAGAWYKGKFYPAKTNYAEGKGSEKINTPKMYVTRMDTMQPLGEVTDGYKVFQNQTAGEFALAMTADPEADFSTAGELDYGRQIWFLCKLKKDLYVGGDAIRPYFLITSSHDGTGRIRVTVCNERVVCANTLAVALGEKGAMSWGTRHVGDVESRIGFAKKSVQLVLQYQPTFLEFANGLVAKKLSTRNANKLINEVLHPLEDDATDKKINAVEKARAIIWEALKAPDLQNFQGTAWAMFNAVTDADQHLRERRGADKDPRGYAERAFTETFQGAMVDRRQLVADFLRKV